VDGQKVAKERLNFWARSVDGKRAKHNRTIKVAHLEFIARLLVYKVFY
jgi:hypothetical protein